MKPLIAMLSLLSCLISIGSSAKQSIDFDSLLQVYQEAKPDTSKVTIAGKLYDYLLYRDQAKALEFANAEITLSKKLNYSKGLALGHYHLGVYYNNSGENDSSNYHYAIAINLARGIKNIRIMSDVNHAMAIQQFYKGQLDSAMAMTEETILLNRQINDSIGMAISLDFLGMIHQNKGNYNIALNYIHEGLDIFQKAGDSIRVADAYTHLAAIESNLSNRQKSINYNLIALRIYEKFNDTYYQSQALNDIGQMYLLASDYDQARQFLESGLEKSLEANSKSITGTIYTNLGKLAIAQKTPEESLDFFRKALEIQNNLKEKRKQIITKNQIARAYNRMGKPKLAIPILDEVIVISDSIDSKSTLRYAYAYHSESHKLMNDYPAALRDFEKYKELSDTLFNNEKSRQIEELRAMHDLEQKESRIALQKEEIKVLNGTVALANLRKTSYAIGMVSFIFIASLIYYSLKQRMKKKEIERLKQEEIYKKEIEYKKKQLVSQTLHLVQKSTFIQELKENLVNASKSQEQFKVEFRRIAMLLRKETALDKDWETFKSYFIDVHNDFESRIKHIYKDITEKEMRLASFLKMNLTTKEIASILNVMPDSVLKSKYRLKKKLMLKKEEDLYSFLKQI